MKTMIKKIAPSMMCVENDTLIQTLNTFEKNGISLLHLDIMDGHFVNNFALGTDYCKNLKKYCSIPLDYHLMIEKPENKLDWFSFGENDYVSIHAESTYHIQRAVSLIKERGAKAGIALNPATPLSELDYITDDLSFVLLMTVNPGFAGQKLVPQTLKKISDLRKLLDEKGLFGCEIEVDGNVSFENARKMSEAGANIFVAGTSSLFIKNDKPLQENIRLFNDVINLR